MASLQTAVQKAIPDPMAGVEVDQREGAEQGPPIPDYLRDVYYWAYLDPRNVRLLDRDLVVSTILFGNLRRLQRAAFEEIDPGQAVLQPAHVYGTIIPNLARLLGPGGRLDVADIAPIQVAACRRKLSAYPWARVRHADARDPDGGPYDVVLCYFLLHELPGAWKRSVVDSLLASVKPGGRVVFVDYHRPHPWHPLRWFISFVLDTLEPFAKALWEHEISDFASRPAGYSWRKETYFGGFYQKVVAERPADDGGEPARWK